MKLFIYKRTVCPNCEQILMILKAKKIPYTVTNLDEDKDAMDMVKNRGFKSAPVLMVKDGDKEIATASGKAIVNVMDWHKKGWI